MKTRPCTTVFAQKKKRLNDTIYDANDIFTLEKLFVSTQSAYTLLHMLQMTFSLSKSNVFCKKQKRLNVTTYVPNDILAPQKHFVLYMMLSLRFCPFCAPRKNRKRSICNGNVTFVIFLRDQKP